ncbi:DsbA family protein [Streptosporangium carneum]|uniref:Membrane protein n=1 Tax=Streptosporangium carneum TaxID=47481 RepID=A0A9W6MEA3_9ACTN|nr:thioredoxin domain-containing protein [Streptosporangium carneum]GLK10917.1 membrane protein [Streptosporangium carneum]
MGKAARDQSVRDRIKAQREEQQHRERLRRVATITAAVVVALGAIGAGWWYAANGSKPEEVTQALAPVTASPDGSVVMSVAGVEKPVLDVYEDFQCPACKAMEETSGATIKNLAAEGKVKVVYHPITIFSQEVNGGVTRANSLRAGAASRCIPGGTPWVKFHDRLFKEQPAETVEGFKLEDLVAWGKEAGVTSAGFETCVTGQQKASEQVDYSTKILQGAQLSGTPTLKLNGTEIGNDVAFKPAELRKAVLNAAK